MKTIDRLMAAALLSIGSLAAQAASTVIVDVTGAQSINLQGETGNTVWFVDVGAHAQLTSLDWAITLNAFSPSSPSDMQVSFGNSSGMDMINFAPATLGYSGSLDLAGLGVAIGADGLLRIEFSETYKDFAAGVAEGEWTGGQLSFGVSAVPEPAGALLALLGLCSLVLQHRRQNPRPRVN